MKKLKNVKKLLLKINFNDYLIDTQSVHTIVTLSREILAILKL